MLWPFYRVVPQASALPARSAAANMVHPATGYSVTRSLVEAEGFAKAVADALEDARWDSPMGPVAQKGTWMA